MLKTSLFLLNRHPFDKLWLLHAFLFSVYSHCTCCSGIFSCITMMPQPVAADAVIHCYAIASYETSDILGAAIEKGGDLIPSSKSTSHTWVSKLFFHFIRNIKGVFTLNSISSLSLVIHLHTYNSYDPCLLCLLPLEASQAILFLCKSFCIHALEDTVSPEKLDNLNRVRILIPFPPLFESGTERLRFARRHREKPAGEPRTKVGFLTSQFSALTTNPAILSCGCLGSWITNLSSILWVIKPVSDDSLNSTNAVTLQPCWAAGSRSREAQLHYSQGYRNKYSRGHAHLEMLFHSGNLLCGWELYTVPLFPLFLRVFRMRV